MSKDKLLIIWGIVVIVLAIVVATELAVYFTREEYRDQVISARAQTEEELQNIEKELEETNFELGEKVEKVDVLEEQKQSQVRTIQELNEKIAGLSTSTEVPFVIPSEGYVATYAGTFGGNMNGMRHLGIDIWTTTQNSGHLSDHKGNPVYSACDGKVVGIDPENAGMTILCDEISGDYMIPAKKVYTHYAHMGHAETKDLFMERGVGSRVSAGDLIGYQGDLSSYFPEMRNVHLHFSVFTGLAETDMSGGALNPCLYIGGECSQIGYEFRK